MRWIKRTTKQDIDDALAKTYCCSIGSVGEVVVDHSQLTSLSLGEIVDQFGLVYSQYEFEGTVLSSGKIFITGTVGEYSQSVFVDDAPKGLFEVCRRLDFDVT
jgi:hypothetical protein